MRNIISIFIFSAFFSLDAKACSVCGFGQDGSQWAYIFTTGLMTALPLGMFGAAIYFIYKYMKTPQTDED